MSAIRVRLLGAQSSFWRSNKFLFLVVWPRSLHFWREPKISSRCYWRCILFQQVLFQQRKMRMSWRWCNNAEIHFWLWNVWSLVVCSKVPFMLQEHVETTKTDKTRCFFAKKRWSWYPTNNCYLMSRSNQPKKQGNKCVWTTKYKKLLEMCIVQYLKKKSVFTFQPKKRLVPTTVKSAKSAATFWIFLLRTKNRQLCCLVVMVHIVLQGRRVATTKKKIHLHFRRYFSANNNQTHPKLNQKRQKFFQLWHNRVDTPLVDTVYQNFIYNIILYTLGLHWSNMIFSVSNDDNEWSLDFWPDSKTLTVKILVQEMTVNSQENPLAAWSLLLSQRQQFLNNHLARIPVTPNQQGSPQIRDEVLSNVVAQDMDTSRYQVSAVLDDVEFYWENNQLDVDAVFGPGLDTLFQKQRLTTWRFSRKPHSARRRRTQGELASSSNSTSLWATNTTLCIVEKSSIWKHNRKCSWLCL